MYDSRTLKPRKRFDEIYDGMSTTILLGEHSNYEPLWAKFMALFSLVVE
jgi:hypothetical protein